MMYLHTDWGYLERQFGCSLVDRFLMPLRSFDNRKAVAPFLVARDDRRFGLFLQVEKGNAEAARLPPDIAPIYYQPYYLFDPAEGGPVHATLEDAVLALADGVPRIVVDSRLPVSVFERLSRRLTAEVETGPELGTVTIRRVNPPEVEARLSRHRGAANEAASRLLARSPVADRIRPFLEAGGNARFAALDALLADAGLNGVLATSILNIQEIAGIPMWGKRRPLAALYLRGGEIWLIESGVAPDGDQIPSPRQALAHLLQDGAIGIEAEDMEIGLFRSLRLDRRGHAAVDDLLRKWRDNDTLPDLAFYIIAARASAHSIESALSWAQDAVRAGEAVTEMDPYSVYLKALHGFVAEVAPFLQVARTLTNFHTSARTIFPANPAPFPLTPAANTLKVDAGCLLFDTDGTLLGCSDIARTLCFSDDAEAIYACEQYGVRNVLVPACKAGAAGSSIHKAGVGAIWPEDGRALSNNPLMPHLKNPVADYNRDVGHLLGKNNLSHLKFVSSERGTLREGMIACCEYQWPYRGHAVAYEDTCLVTASGGLNFTTDKQ